MRTQKETTFNPPSVIRAGDHFDRKQTEKELYQALQQKNEELVILHNVNSRLAKELSHLQLKLGIDPFQILKQLEQIGQISPISHADLGQLRYLKELFVAYDGTIAKQKKIIAMLYSQLADSQKKSQSIVRQNEYLMEQNKNKCKKILQIYHRGYPEQNLTNSYSKLLREMEQEKNLLVREESEHVIDIYKQLENHSHNIEIELQESKISAEKYFRLFKKQSEELKESLLSVDNLLKVREFLEKTVSKIGQQNITLQNAKNDLQTKVAKLQIQIKSLRNQLFAQKKINRQENERISIEIDNLKSETDSAIKRQRQTFNANLIHQKDLQNFKETARSLKRQNEKIKSQLEQTIKMCQAYQSKITSLTRKQQGIAQMLDKNKEKLDAILLQKDKAHLKVQQLEKIMQNMSARHRDEMVKVRQNYERMNADQQQKIRMYDEERQQAESLFLQTELNYKNQIQKLKRQNSLLHDQNMKFIENIHVNTGSQITNKLKEYETKNESLFKMINQKDRQIKEQQGKYEQIVHDYENQIRNINRLLEKEKNLTTQYMKEITQERSKASILSNEKECLENEIKKLKKNNQYKKNQLHDDKEFRISQLQTKLNQAVKKQKEIRQKAIDMLEHYDEEQVKLKNEYDKKIVELEGENQKLRRKVQKLKRKAD